jgi:hypothetical protein
MWGWFLHRGVFRRIAGTVCDRSCARARWRRWLRCNQRSSIHARWGLHESIYNWVAVTQNPRGHGWIVPSLTFRACNLEMKVGAARPPSLPRVADQVSRFDPLARYDDDFRKVKVLRLPTILMRDDDIVGFSSESGIATANVAVTSNDAHDPVQRTNDRYSFGHPKIPRPGVVLQVATGPMPLRDRVGAPTAEGHHYVRWLGRNESRRVSRRELNGGAEDQCG